MLGASGLLPGLIGQVLQASESDRFPKLAEVRRDM